MHKENIQQDNAREKDDSRKIIISQEINDEIVAPIISKIIEINEADAKLWSNDNNYEPEPIEIFINSPGGSISSGFAIIDAMEISETPIITYGMGLVASMALGIFVAGDVRVSTRHTRFMYHSASYGIYGSVQDHKEAIEEINLLEKMYDDLILERTKFTKEKMEEIKNAKKDFYFSPKEALKLGVVDRIIFVETIKNRS